ncbi:MAG: hypothetical protein ACYCXY_09085 [Acidimicrobiales bacterium]
MFILLGLVVLVAAVVVGVSGVVENRGSAHLLTHGFAVLGYHVTGSTGTLFLYGAVVGALALLGLSIVFVGERRTSRRGRVARRGLAQSRGETAAARDDRRVLVEQRSAARSETARAEPARVARGDTAGDAGRSSPHRSMLHPFAGRGAVRSTT